MRNRFRLACGLAALATAASFALGCGGSALQVPAMQQVEKIRTAPAAREGQELAPQMYAIAEGERQKSRAAYDAGDDATAEIYAERAAASYENAFILARLAKATKREMEARKALAATEDDAARYEKARQDLDREADALEKKLAVARDALVPAPSGATDAQREAARLVASRSLVTEASLLCGAAELVGADAKALEEPKQNLADLQKQLDGTPKPAPIDASARVRASCLSVLTRARRANDSQSSADALLTELSAAGAWSPARDERGVVVTLRDIFQGNTLNKDGEKKLGNLGRVLAAHPGLAAQVVVHDATQPGAKDTNDQARADAASKALVAAAPNAKVRTDLAGARLPVVDPADARHRARNARLDVVFVTSSN
jgi:flagellar motor protein MotB